MHNSTRWFLPIVIGMYVSMPITVHSGNFDTISAPTGQTVVPFANPNTMDSFSDDDVADEPDEQSHNEQEDMTDSSEPEETSAEEPQEEMVMPEETEEESQEVSAQTKSVEEEADKDHISEDKPKDQDNQQESREEDEQQETTEAEEEEIPKRVEPAPEQEEPESEMIGPEDVKIDTIDLTEPKGNWLLKRWWWEQAEILYEKIKQREEEVFEERMEFLRKRIDMDRAVFNPFYKTVGIGQGELSETITMLISQVEHERKKSGALSEQERDFLDILQTERKTLAQLQENIGAISDADLAIDDALLKLMEQINRVRGYERQAWDRFKAIARELSDQRAYELYEEMKGLSRNVTDILLYIRQPFAHYFQNLSVKVTEQVERIKTDIQTLKEKGIDLKQESAHLNAQESKKEEQAREQACAAQVKKAIAQTQAQKRGLFGMIADFFRAIGRAITAPFRYIIRLFTGPTPARAPKKPSVVPATPLSKPQEIVQNTHVGPNVAPSTAGSLPAFPEPPSENQN